MNLEELLTRLRDQDPLTIIELLNIDSEMLVERFIDIVELRASILEQEL